MTDKTLCVVGAGPGLGLAVARRFGREGFKVALISRRREKLEALIAQLADDRIEAAGFTADIADEASLIAALSAVKLRFGAIDVLEFSPSSVPANGFENYPAIRMGRDLAATEFHLAVLGAVTCIQQVLPDMLAKGDGAILLTTSGSAVTPMQVYTPICLSMGALRNYAYCLHEALANTGVFAATMCISVLIRQGEIGDPDRLANIYFDMYIKQDRMEEVITGAVHPNDLHNQDMEERGLDWERAKTSTTAPATGN